MSSDAEQSLIERLIRSRNRDLSLFLPIILGLTNNIREEEDPDRDPDRETADDPQPGSGGDRVILINPVTQGMVVIQGMSPSSMDSLLRDLLNNKDGQPPASKASVEAMPTVLIGDGDGDAGGECVVCLEEWEVGEEAREMPCQHKFHGGCIEKWLGIHGSCPICRYKMPVDDECKKSAAVDVDAGVDGRGRRRREIWVSLSFSSDRRDGGDQTHDQAAGDESSGDTS